MQLLKRALQIFLVIVIVILLVGGGAGYWFATKSHPQIDGTLQVKGLKSKVEVVRDAMGVPHIYADNADDLMFAQGYVVAQDRLWQLDYNRRIGHGMLSDVLGAAAITQDRFLRTIGLARAARADLAVQSDEVKHVMQMYANGINAFIESHQDNLPLEFTILGYKPAPWEPVDTIVWAKVMSMDLSGRYAGDLFRGQIAEKFGEAKMRELTPPYPATGPFIVPPEAKDYRSQLPITNHQSPITSLGNPDWDQINQLLFAVGSYEPDLGSNDWVIDGTKSKTGKPILASDQHLGLQMPSIWYQIGLHCVPVTAACPYNVAGVTFAGAPGVIVGHNDRIAWGVTNVGPDTQDLYVEEIQGNQSKFKDKWEDLQIVEEPIKVKGVVSETLHVQITRHGPIMTPVLAGVTRPLALQWVALRERSRLFESVMLLNRAKNWDEFRAALKLWDMPSQNFVYADVDGNIGYQMPGSVPIRAKGDGTLPVPGSTGEYEWTGYVPFDELPFVFNPPTHFIASANNAVVPPTYKYMISYDWAAPYRVQRITDLLKAKDKLGVDDIAALQADVYSIPVVALQKYVVALKPEGFLQDRAMMRVKEWDGRLTTDNIGGTIIEVTYQRLVRNIFSKQLDADLLRTYLGFSDNHRRLVLAMLDNPKNVWWGGETRDVVLQKSFAEAVDYLGSQFGDAPNEWRWGRLHTANFTHTLGAVQPLDRIFNSGPFPAPGGVYTVFATSFRGATPYTTAHITSQRQIIDVTNWDNSIHVNTTGQSGQPFNKHYLDNVMLWRDVKYTPFAFTRGAVEKSREETLVLVP